MAHKLKTEFRQTNRATQKQHQQQQSTTKQTTDNIVKHTKLSIHALLYNSQPDYGNYGYSPDLVLAWRILTRLPLSTWSNELAASL